MLGSVGRWVCQTMCTLPPQPDTGAVTRGSLTPRGARDALCRRAGCSPNVPAAMYIGHYLFAPDNPDIVVLLVRPAVGSSFWTHRPSTVPGGSVELLESMPAPRTVLQKGVLARLHWLLILGSCIPPSMALRLAPSGSHVIHMSRAYIRRSGDVGPACLIMQRATPTAGTDAVAHQSVPAGLARPVPAWQRPTSRPPPLPEHTSAPPAQSSLAAASCWLRV
jgi:hypothetical protein